MIREMKEISLGFPLLLNCVKHYRYSSQVLRILTPTVALLFCSYRLQIFKAQTCFH